jgi:hypothetical protein
MYYLTCIKVALSQHHLMAVDGAHAASSGCPPVELSITVKITRKGSGYTAHASGPIRKVASRKSAVALSCQHKGGGLMLPVRPRVKGKTLRQVVGPALTMAYVNLANTPVTLRTMFKVN